MNVGSSFGTTVRHICPRRLSLLTAARALSTDASPAQRRTPRTTKLTPLPTTPRRPTIPNRTTQNPLLTQSRAFQTTASKEPATELPPASTTEAPVETPLPATTSQAFEPATEAPLQAPEPLSTTSSAPSTAGPSISPYYQPSTTRPPLPYHVHRTGSRNLPVYQLAKAGGNRKLTAIQKVWGDSEALRAALVAALEPRAVEAWVNHVNGHVVVKGWHKAQVEQWLRDKGF